jgi:hypothetical protein
MRRLLAKDVRLVTRWLWLIVPAHVLWCAQAFLVPELYFWLSLAASLAWTVAVLAIEWHFGTDRFVASLPVTRATTVRARYTSALGAVLLGAALFVLYGHLLMAMATESVVARWDAAAVWRSPDGVAAFAIVGFALVIVFLPFYFRFGLPLGGSLFTTFAGLAGLAGMAFARPAGRGASLAAGGAARGAPPSEVVRGWLSELAAWSGAGPAALVVLAAAALLGATSLWLSIRFYEGRDL